MMIKSNQFNTDVYIADFTKYNQAIHDVPAPVKGVYIDVKPNEIIPSFRLKNKNKHPFVAINLEENRFVRVGYTFAGWKDGTPQDEINYEPLLKKPDDNLVVSSNKTYHAVYYYYDEEEDIDWSEEFTTGIYADVNGIKYFLAGTPDHGTMSSTTDCGYVSEVTITPGTGENAGKYKITVNSVGMAPEAGETDLVAGTAQWTITETSVGSGDYKISGADKKNIVLSSQVLFFTSFPIL